MEEKVATDLSNDMPNEHVTNQKLGESSADPERSDDNPDLSVDLPIKKVAYHELGESSGGPVRSDDGQDSDAEIVKKKKHKKHKKHKEHKKHKKNKKEDDENPDLSVDLPIKKVAYHELGESSGGPVRSDDKEIFAHDNASDFPDNEIADNESLESYGDEEGLICLGEPVKFDGDDSAVDKKVRYRKVHKKPFMYLEPINPIQNSACDNGNYSSQELPYFSNDNPNLMSFISNVASYIDVQSESIADVANEDEIVILYEHLPNGIPIGNEHQTTAPPAEKVVCNRETQTGNEHQTTAPPAEKVVCNRETQTLHTAVNEKAIMTISHQTTYHGKERIGKHNKCHNSSEDECSDDEIISFKKTKKKIVRVISSDSEDDSDIPSKKDQSKINFLSEMMSRERNTNTRSDSVAEPFSDEVLELISGKFNSEGSVTPTSSPVKSNPKVRERDAEIKYDVEKGEENSEIDRNESENLMMNDEHGKEKVRDPRVKEFIEDEAELSGDDPDGQEHENDHEVEQNEPMEYIDDSETYDTEKDREEVVQIHLKQGNKRDADEIEYLKEKFMPSDASVGTSRKKKFRWNCNTAPAPKRGSLTSSKVTMDLPLPPWAYHEAAFHYLSPPNDDKEQRDITESSDEDQYDGRPHFVKLQFNSANQDNEINGAEKEEVHVSDSMEEEDKSVNTDEEKEMLPPTKKMKMEILKDSQPKRSDHVKKFSLLKKKEKK